MALTYQMNYNKNLRRNLISVGAAVLLLAPCALPWKNYSNLRLLSSLASAIIFGCVGLKEADKRTKEEELELLNWDNYVIAYQNQQIARLEQDATLIDDQPQALLSAGEIESSPTKSHSVVNALKTLGVTTQLIEEINATAFTRIKLKLGQGVKFQHIKNLGNDLQINCGYETAPFIASGNGCVTVDIPREDREFCAFENYQISDKFTIPVGVDINGKLIEANLADANNPHFLVGGTTGSGKSEFLVAIICSLISRFTPEQIQIIGIDPKRVSFPFFENLPWCSVIKDQEAAIAKLDLLVEEMESRYQIFEDEGVRDLAEYSAKNLTIIPRIIVVFDEFADFVADKKDKEDFESRIKKLAAKARGAGIHLILATQRPDATVVTPLIRSNLPGRIALQTLTPEDGKIVMGHDCPSNQLLGKGDLFFGSGGSDLRLQSLWVKDPIQLVEKAKSKLSINVVSPVFTAKPPEASPEPAVKPISKPSTPILSRNEYIIKILGEALAQLPNKPEIPLFDSHYDLSIEEKLLVVRSLLYKKIGKEDSILVLWGRPSGGKNHHLYQACSECFEQMKDKLREQGFGEKNDWGFK
jgi:hypothetical protein